MAAAIKATAASAQETHRDFLARETISGETEVPGSSVIHRSSRFRSAALCHRSSGSLARHVFTSRLRAGGDIGWKVEMGAGSEDMIAVMREAWLAPEKAFFPVAIS